MKDQGFAWVSTQVLGVTSRLYSPLWARRRCFLGESKDSRSPPISLPSRQFTSWIHPCRSSSAVSFEEFDGLGWSSGGQRDFPHPLFLVVCTPSTLEIDRGTEGMFFPSRYREGVLEFAHLDTFGCQPLACLGCALVCHDPHNDRK